MKQKTKTVEKASEDKDQKTEVAEETILDLDSIPEFEAVKSENQDEELDDIDE